MAVHTSHPDILKRLKRASGHLTKVVTMIEAEAPCADVAQQLYAVIKALEAAKGVYVQDHIEHCIDDGLNGDAADVRELIAELKSVSRYL